MKKNLLFALLFLSASSVGAQSFKFFHNDKEVKNNTEITIDEVIAENWGTDEEPEWHLTMETGISLKNISNQPVNGIGSITFISSPAPMGEAQFCFSVCQFTNTSLSQEKKVDANSYVPGYHIAYTPIFGSFEKASARLDVKNKDNQSDNQSITVHFQYLNASGLQDVNASQKVKLFQQDNLLIVQAGIKNQGSLIIRDITGKEVVHYVLKAGRNQLTHHLPKGIYIYSVQEGNKNIALNKMIIR